MNKKTTRRPANTPTEGAKLFCAFVDSFETRAAAAKALGEAPSAVHYWCNGEQRPGAEKRTKIEQLSGGAVPAASWRTAKERAEFEKRAAIATTSATKRTG